jgi:predicted dehydrogenase
MKSKGLSRRDVLKSVVPTAALANIVPASVFGREGTPPPSERLSLGAIGVGAQGFPDMKSFARMKDVRVTALCDVNQRNIQRARKLLGDQYGADDVRIYSDFRELNARDDIDVVLIATPCHWHAIPALDAAAQGKHMYLEKPMTMSVREDKMLRAAVKKNNVVFQFGTQQRSDLKFRWACELARNGRLGPLKRIEVAASHGLQSEVFAPEPAPDWLDWDRWVGPAPWAEFSPKRLERGYHENIRDYSLGMIACWGIHHLDIAQWGNGTEHTGPVSIKGTGAFPDSGTCNAILDWDVTFEFDGAAPILFSDSERRPHGIRFVGEERSVLVRRGVIETENREFLLDPQNRPGTMPIQLPVNREEHTRDLIEAIRTGRSTVAGIDTALRSNTLCHLALAAVELGRTLRWDPVAENFAGGAEDNKRLEPRPQRGAYQLPKT